MTWQAFVMVAIVCVRTVLGSTRSPVDGMTSLDVTKMVCPYNKMCTSEPTLEIADRLHMPCCQLCSCSSDCHTTYNCCPDSQLPDRHAAIYPCTTLEHFLNPRLTMSYNHPMHGTGYRIIDTCPPDIVNMTLATLCKRRERLSDFVLVSDVTNDKLYGNRHCAQCNGVFAVIPWNMYMDSCESALWTRFDTFQERDTHILSKCLLVATPPDPMFGVRSTCFFNGNGSGQSSMVSMCNVTTSWDEYDAEIEASCLREGHSQGQLYVFQMANAGLLVYANPFCYLCNNPVSKSSTGTCAHTIVNSGSLKKNTTFPAKLNVKIANYDDQSDGICRSFEIFDNVTGICKRIHCPHWTIPFGGTCVPMFVDTDDLNLEIYFALLFEESLTPQALILHESVLRRITDDVLTPVGTCEPCYSEVHSDTSTTIYYLKLVIESSLTCQFSKLKSAVKMIAQKGLRHTVVSFGKEYEAIVIPIIEQFPKHLILMSFYNGTAVCPTAVRFDSSILNDQCPSIEFTRSQLLQLGLNDSTISAMHATVSFTPVSPLINTTEVPDVNQVCLHDYFRLIAPVRSRDNTAYLTSSSGTNIAMFELFAIIIVLFVFGTVVPPHGYCTLIV